MLADVRDRKRKQATHELMETVKQHRPLKNHRQRFSVMVFVLFTLSGLVEVFLCANFVVEKEKN